MTADLLEKCVGPFKRALKDANLEPKGIEPRHPGGRSTRMPMVAVNMVAQAQRRQRAPQGHQPRRGSGHGRRYPGRRAQGRGQRHPASGRNAPFSWHRHHSRAECSLKLIEPATHDPSPRAKGREYLLPRRPTVRPAWTSRSIRARGRWLPTTNSSATSTSWASRRRRAECHQIEVAFDIDADGHPACLGKDMATGHEQKITITGVQRAQRGRDREDGHGSARGPCRGGPPASVKRPTCATTPTALVYTTEKSLRELGDQVSPEDARPSRRPWRMSRKPSRVRTTTTSGARRRSSPQLRTSWPSTCTPRPRRKAPIWARGRRQLRRHRGSRGRGHRRGGIRGDVIPRINGTLPVRESRS